MHMAFRLTLQNPTNARRCLDQTPVRTSRSARFSRSTVQAAHFDGLMASGWHQPPKPVFQHPQLPIESVAPQDARDAMETCSNLKGEMKDACYLIFGCDRHGVEQYLTVVEGLESAFQTEPDTSETFWRRDFK